MKKHTNGKWHISESQVQQHYNSFFYVSCNRENKPTNQIAKIFQVDITPDETEANAKLISAAPSMYDALIAVEAFYERLGIPVDDETKVMLEKVRCALDDAML